MWTHFAKKLFSGNPAAIVFIDEHKDKNDQWMQSFSTELNLSETAYLKVLGQNSWNLRWFTPLLEVDLCGHATLATVKTLIHTKRLNYDEKVTVNSPLSFPLLMVRNSSLWIFLQNQ